MLRKMRKEEIAMAKRLINLVMEDEFIDKFDKWVEQKGYATRSEAIRDAMRLLMNQGRERMRTQ